MSSKRRAVSTLAVVVVLAVPLAVASLAFACGRLATLKLDRASGRAGATVDAVGRNFNTNAAASPVALRFNSRNGRVLWEGRADQRGMVRATFTIPRARAGHYVIVATQEVAEGRPAAGTPGRAPLRVRGRTRSDSAVAALPPSGGTTGSAGGGAPEAPMALAALLLVGLATGAGGLMAGRRRRACAAPAPHDL